MERRKGSRSRPKKVGSDLENASKIALDQWFSEELKSNANLKSWQLNELKIFFRKQGLTEKEDRKAYREALSKY